MKEEDILERLAGTFNTEESREEIGGRVRKTEIAKEAMNVISQLRRKGWDLLRIARATNVSEQTIRNWMRGRATPQPNNLLALRRLKEIAL